MRRRSAIRSRSRAWTVEASEPSSTTSTVFAKLPAQSPSRPSPSTARRGGIVEGLRTPGSGPEQLLEVISCRRADGREVSLAELPLAQQFTSAETVRAEEMVLSVPDGRSVATLVNATPIHAEGRHGPPRWGPRRPAGLPRRSPHRSPHRPISAPDVTAARTGLRRCARPPGFAETTRRQPPRLATVPPGPAVARRSTTPHPDRFAHSAPIYDHTASEAHRKAGAMNKAQLTSLVADQVSLSKDTARPRGRRRVLHHRRAARAKRQRLVRGLRRLHPQGPVLPPRARPRSRSALEPVRALLSGAGRRGLVDGAGGRRHGLALAFRPASARPRAGMRIALPPFRMSPLTPHTALHSSDSSIPSDAGVQRGLPLPRCAVLAEDATLK